MKKIALFVSLFLIFAFTVSAKALTTEIAGEEGSVVSYNILAKLPERSSAAQLRFSVNGGTINSITVGSNELIMLGTCENFSTYMDSLVCADIAVSSARESGELIEGEVLATVEIQKTGTSEISFVPAPDYAYLTITSDLLAEDGTFLSDADASGVTEQPQPSPTDDVSDTGGLSSSLVLLILILVVLVGAFIAILFYSNRSTPTPTDNF